MRPLIAITCDLCDSPNGERLFSYRTYGAAVRRAGGIPIWIEPGGDAAELVARFDGLLLTGGDDPRTEPFGEPSHPEITPVHSERQAFESSLIGAIAERPEVAVLGVCLGMQMMALHAGGALDQHLPDSRQDWRRHWEASHPVEACQSAAVSLSGVVHSKHRQAVADPGGMTVSALSDDGLIEAVEDPLRAFYVGVQWHPERTAEHAVGDAVFEAFIQAAGRARPSP